MILIFMLLHVLIINLLKTEVIIVFHQNIIYGTQKSVNLLYCCPRLKAFALPIQVNSNRSPRRMY